MNDIVAILSIARRRLRTTDFVRRLHIVAVVVAGVALALAVIDRLPAQSIMPWAWIAPALATLALIAAGILSSRRRLSEVQVALAVDDRLHLREQLSTAMHCRHRDDPFAQAAVEDAVTIARRPQTREAVRRHFKVGAPPNWWISPTLLVLAFGVLLLPQLDAFAREEPIDQKGINVAQQEANETVKAVADVFEEKPELKSQMADLLGQLTDEPLETPEARSPEDVKREAIKRVTDLNKKVEEILSGERGQAAKLVNQSMKRLQLDEEGPAKDVADALAKGDFAAAKQALEKLAKDIEDGKANPEQAAKAAEQLQQLAQQLEQMARNRQALENALKQAGMDPQLAQNAQALQQAIQNNQNLNQQQKQQLQQLANAQQQACQQCQGLGQAMQQMAQAMQNGQGAGQAGQQAGQQLDQMEQMQQLVQQAQAAANELQGQCEGLGQGVNMNQAMQQWMQQQGRGGMGQRGQGAGGRAQLAPTPTGTKAAKADVETREGEIIARMLFEGPVTVGESTMSRSRVVQEQIDGFDEAQPEEELPIIYRDAMQHFFGELERQAETIDRRSERQPDNSSENSNASGSDDGGADGSSSTESNED